MYFSSLLLIAIHLSVQATIILLFHVLYRQVDPLEHTTEALNLHRWSQDTQEARTSSQTIKTDMTVDLLTLSASTAVHRLLRKTTTDTRHLLIKTGRPQTSSVLTQCQITILIKTRWIALHGSVVTVPRIIIFPTVQIILHQGNQRFLNFKFIALSPPNQWSNQRPPSGNWDMGPNQFKPSSVSPSGPPNWGSSGDIQTNSRSATPEIWRRAELQITDLIMNGIVPASDMRTAGKSNQRAKDFSCIYRPRYWPESICPRTVLCGRALQRDQGWKIRDGSQLPSRIPWSVPDLERTANHRSVLE